MIWFIILGVLLLLAIICRVITSFGDYRSKKPFKRWISSREDLLIGVFWIQSIVSLLILVPLCCTIAGIDSEFDRVINEYNATKNLIESYECGNYGNSPALTEKIIQLNDEISNHKAKWNNPWFNMWNSERIGNLEPLKLPMSKK